MVSAGPNVVFCTEMLPSAVSLIVFKAVHSVNTSSPRSVACGRLTLVSAVQL